MGIATDTATNLKHRWRMLALIWLVYACFGITVGSLPPLVSFITEDLGLSSTQMGLVLGAWQLVYIFTASPLGTIVDKFGVRRSIIAGLLIILISLVTRAAAFNFYSLFATVALFGVGGPIISIGAPKAVSEWFHGKERGLAAGIYTTAPLAGVAIALASAASIVEPITGSWRGIAWVYGLIILAVLGLWTLAAVEPPNAKSNASSGNNVGWAATLSIVRLTNVRIVLVLALVTFLASHGFQNWLPTLLIDDGMDVANAGSWVSLAIIAGAISLIFIPSMSKYGNRRFIMAAMLLGSSLSGYGLVIFEGVGQVSAITAWSIARSPIIAVSMLILMDTKGVGKARMGSAAGLFYAVAEVGGFSGPFILGAIRDLTGNLDMGIILISSAVLMLIILMKFIKESPLDTHALNSKINTSRGP